MIIEQKREAIMNWSRIFGVLAKKPCRQTQIYSDLQRIDVKENWKGDAGKLIEELEMINKESFGMARSIHEQPALRTQAAEKASLLKKRLLDIAKELEQIAPEEHKRWCHAISESLLDLDFVVEDRGMTSLRLGDIIRWG